MFNNFIIDNFVCKQLCAIAKYLDATVFLHNHRIQLYCNAMYELFVGYAQWQWKCHKEDLKNKSIFRFCTMSNIVYY